MANHSERDNSGTDMRNMKNSQSNDKQSGSGGSSHANSGKAQSGSGRGISGPSSGGPGSTRPSSEMGPMHTNAGNTGFSSDQISPKTQNLPQTGPSASHPATSQGGRGDRKG